MSLTSTPAAVNHASPPPAQLPPFMLPDYHTFEGKSFKKTPDSAQWVRHIPGWRSCHTDLFTIIRAAGHRPVSMSWIAKRYNADTRRVERLVKEMEAAGWVRVDRRTTRTGRDLSNLYDFTPAIIIMGQIAAKMRATEQAERAAAAPAAEAPASPVRDTPLPLVLEAPVPPVRDTGPYEKVLTYLENGNEVSVPPTPVAQAIEPATDEEANARPQARFDADYQALVEPLAAIGEELGDQAHPLATVTRAYKLMTAAGLDVGPFLDLMEEARLHTLSAIQARRRNKPPKPVDNPMAYFFGVLVRLTQPDQYPPQWRTGPPRRRQAAAPATLPPSSPPSDVWEAVTAEAGQVMTPENIARWFVPAQQVEHAGDVLTVAVPNDFHRQWLDTRLRAKVEQCAARVQPGLQVCFVVRS